MLNNLKSEEATFFNIKPTIQLNTKYKKSGYFSGSEDENI